VEDFNTYGIFDGEADAVIDLVRRHAPLAGVCGTPCPACGAAMYVTFSDDGHVFKVSCKGRPLHMSKYQDIVEPPPWWSECVVTLTDSTWYWQEWHSFDASGNLAMKISGCQADGVRWCGQLDCKTDDPDYSFWVWVLSESGCTSDLIDDAELADLRVRFAKWSNEP
jgi:hypothetical protein